MKIKNKTIIISIILIVFIVLITISIVYMQHRNKKNSKKNSNKYKDFYTQSQLSDEEYNKISESTISMLEEKFGKDGGFEIKNIEKGYIEIDDVAAPQPYKKIEVYSKFLDKTFDVESTSFLSELLQKYFEELREKIEKINDNMTVNIDKRIGPVSNYGHIPTLEEIPNEYYRLSLSYTIKNQKKSSNDIENFKRILKTDIKEAYNLILEKDHSYKNRKIEIKYVVDNSVNNYKYITIICDPTTETINLEGYNMEIPNNQINWNEVF